MEALRRSESWLNARAAPEELTRRASAGLTAGAGRALERTPGLGRALERTPGLERILTDPVLPIVSDGGDI
ncbi:hypothetical protein DPX16_13870 [Anabarilius grahami]|uniref:Uncharacterized protein n=1 Tax=Anabarilius grahami TaxID=495550 RepID=A0A3N0XVM1_ANAGA|nr:hypothetical protein DPX16_13870 [Anabarilius grahami]